MEWTENNIARALALQIMDRRCLVMVPNCNWTGHECDVLGVTKDLRVIDFEVKISRADLKVDAKKEKWWIRRFQGWSEPHETVLNGRPVINYRSPIYDNQAQHWPPKVWKHYYVLPAEIWKDELLQALPSPASGVILLDEWRGEVRATIKRQAKPNREAKPIDAAAAVDLARLASLRMWSVLQTQERAARRKTKALQPAQT
jgi:hypothetical protein